MIAAPKPPTNPGVGDAYFNTTVNKLYVFNGFLWFIAGAEEMVPIETMWWAVLQVEAEKMNGL